MQLGLKQELDARELSNGATTIAWVVTAVWLRYVELNGTECVFYRRFI
jgi:hypothetical protein